MFGFLTKVLRPILSVGQKAIPALKSGLGAIGSKIATGYRSLRNLLTGRFGKVYQKGSMPVGKEHIVSGGVNKGTADIAGGIRKVQMDIFKPPVRSVPPPLPGQQQLFPPGTITPP